MSDPLPYSMTSDTPVAPPLPDGDYAIAEIMGHSTMIGRYAEVERFGTKMLAIEPIWEDALLPAVFVGGSSLYRFTPCSKEVAQKRQPRSRHYLPDALRATLPPETPTAIPPPQRAEDAEDEMQRVEAEIARDHEDEEYDEVQF